VVQLTVTSFASPSLAHVTRPGVIEALVNVGLLLVFAEFEFDPLVPPEPEPLLPEPEELPPEPEVLPLEPDDPPLVPDPPDPDWSCPLPLELAVVVGDCDDAFVPVPPPHAANENIPTLASATEAAIPRCIPALP
jgi:hypothetical protein